ncbi:gamma-glutamyltransferase [Actinomadura alba]|uniref:Glutathione hydrolase proenzyme n=1 Tax=Actinomadura alba TaxID=406431 RepID=A0ABR7LT76_9ACTN|nr:gamma-glutamyltransferase [Actinomadura alba]
MRRVSRRVAIPALAGAMALSLVQTPAAQARPRPIDKQPTATGYGGAVASLDPYASKAGLEILRRGGNAVDAAIATSAALGVTRPYDGSIGGGGFLVIYSAKTGKVTTIDTREAAPAAAKPDLFIDPSTGQPIPFTERRVSGLSIGVPGVVRGWERALDEFGKMPLRRVLEPATRLAEDGFIVDEQYQSRTASNLAILRDFTSSRDTFLTEDGQAPQVGTVFRNEELARTYKILAAKGASAFYKGDIAEAIADTVTDPPVVPGSTRNVRSGAMKASDLADYRALEKPPTEVGYRGVKVHGMSPPSSGGSTVGEALNILENFDLKNLPRGEALHRLIESSALSFADRNAYIGDDRYVDVPLTGLLSQGYGDERSKLIGPRSATKPVAAGNPWPYNGGGGKPRTGGAGDVDGSTTHLTTADRWGNVVAYTFTLEQISGSGIAVPGYGFLLNNELTDFSADPNDPANAPAAGKRPRSSMTPTIVTKDGRPLLATGSPGSAVIITSVLQVLVNHLDFGMSLPEAIAAPRLSNTNSATTTAEQGLVQSPEGDALRGLGHQFTQTGTLGNMTGVAFLRDGRLQAAAEPVRLGGGSAMVVHPADRR